MNTSTVLQAFGIGAVLASLGMAMGWLMVPFIVGVLFVAAGAAAERRQLDKKG